MGFLKYATVPVVNMESAGTSFTILAVPLLWQNTKPNTDQSGFDLGCPKALPQAVPNSFVGNDAVTRC
jgi:hypothetical protein